MKLDFGTLFRSRRKPTSPTSFEVEFSVVVPTRERSDALRVLLMSFGPTFPGEPSFELILADAGSRDSTPELCRAFAETSPLVVSYLSVGACTLPEAANAAFQEAKGGQLLLLGETRVATLELLQRHREARGCVHAATTGVSPALAIAHLCNPWVALESGSLMTPASRIFLEIGVPRSVGNDGAVPPDEIDPGNFSAHRDSVLEMGGLNESFVTLDAAVKDLARRLAAAGVATRAAPTAIAASQLSPCEVGYSAALNGDYAVAR